MVGQATTLEVETFQSPKKPRVKCSRWNAAKKPHDITQQPASSTDPPCIASDTFDTFEGWNSPGDSDAPFVSNGSLKACQGLNSPGHSSWNSPGNSPLREREDSQMMNFPRHEEPPPWAMSVNVEAYHMQGVNVEACHMQANMEDYSIGDPFSGLQTAMAFRQPMHEAPMEPPAMVMPVPMSYQSYEARHDALYWSMPQIPELPAYDAMPFPEEGFGLCPRTQASAARRISNRKLAGATSSSQFAPQPIATQSQAPGGAIVGQRLLHMLQGRGLQTLHSMEREPPFECNYDAGIKPARRGEAFGSKADTQDLESYSDCSTVDTLGAFGLAPALVHADCGHQGNLGMPAGWAMQMASTGMPADAGGHDNGMSIIRAASTSALVTNNGQTLPASPLGSADMPTLGSKGHFLGSCKPCAFYHKDGCENGLNCKFCHICDQGAKKRRQKEKLAMRRVARPLVSGQCAEDAMYQQIGEHASSFN